MKLTGDERGIELLKKFHETKNEYLKFILQESKTSFGNIATFNDEENKQSYQLKYNPSTGEFLVEKL